MYWLLYLFIQNKGAILSLPQEVKIILIVSLVITIGLGIIKKVWRLVKVAAVVAVIYFLLTTMGVV